MIESDILEVLATIPDIRMVFEVGCDCMVYTTPTLRRLFPAATLHCFDPLPSNQAIVKALDAEAALNAHFYPLALIDDIGICPFWPSTNRGYSSSVKEPVIVGDIGNAVSWSSPIRVPCVTLDAFCHQRAIPSIDLLHMDVQSGEAMLLKGAKQMLPHIRYIFTEHNTTGSYKDEPGLQGIMALLPGWSAVHVWPYDALLRNDAYISPAP